MEMFLLKVTALVITFTIILPIVKFYILLKAKQKVKQKLNPREMNFRELQQLKEIYVQERKPYYEECRILFNTLCKKGLMHHEELILLRKLLEDALGEYKHDYDFYVHTDKVKQKNGSEKEITKKGFSNEYHRIYTYLKSWHIDVQQWQEILNFLNSIYEKEMAQ